VNYAVKTFVLNAKYPIETLHVNNGKFTRIKNKLLSKTWHNWKYNNVRSAALDFKG